MSNFNTNTVITAPIATTNDMKKWVKQPSKVSETTFGEIDLLVSVPLIDIIEATSEEVYEMVAKMVIDETSPYSLENWLCPLVGSDGGNVLLRVTGHITN